METEKPTTVDAYIEAASVEARPILERIREIVREAAPEAEEVISYQMPAWKQNGILIHVGAFKKHIGLYPPVTGDPLVERAAAPYAGPKGNLQFSLSEPIPYDLIRRIVRMRVTMNASGRT